MGTRRLLFTGVIRQFLALSIVLTGLKVHAVDPLVFDATLKPNLCRLAFATDQRVGFREVVRFSDGKFADRGWTAEFMAERMKLAEKFPDSEYYYTQNNGKITGALAATFAHFSPMDALRFPNVQLLPMESSLQKFLGRPVGMNGRSMITEMRTYAIEKEFHDSAKSSLFFSALGSVVRKYKRDYPELMDKHVVFTYGDEVSLKLYGAMGFKNLSEKWGEAPIAHAGTNWWILGITPRELETLLHKEYARYFRKNRGNESVVILPDGRKVTVTAEIGKNDLRHLTEDTEIRENLWAAKGSDVVLTKEGQLLEIAAIAKTYRDPVTGITADAGAHLQFFPHSGRLHSLSKAAEPFEMEPGVWVRAGDRVEWLPNGDYFKIGTRFYNPRLNHPLGLHEPKRPLESEPETGHTVVPLFRR